MQSYSAVYLRYIWGGVCRDDGGDEARRRCYRARTRFTLMVPQSGGENIPRCSIKNPGDTPPAFRTYVSIFRSDYKNVDEGIAFPNA